MKEKCYFLTDLVWCGLLITIIGLIAGLINFCTIRNDGYAIVDLLFLLTTVYLFIESTKNVKKLNKQDNQNSKDYI